MGIYYLDGIHELGHSRISMGCKYIEVGVGLYYTSFVFHSRFEYSLSGQRSRLFHCFFFFFCHKIIFIHDSEQVCINAFDSVLAWLLRRESCNFEVNLRPLIYYLPNKAEIEPKDHQQIMTASPSIYATP
jgi:hypothetical protein